MTHSPEKTDLAGCTEEELRTFLLSLGEPSYRAKQLFSALQHGIPLEEISTLPLALRTRLSDPDLTVNRMPQIENALVSRDGTVKYLIRLFDNQCVETVFMRYEHGTSVCLSTQAGCRMGCAFCASTIGGKVRDLYPSEMLGQVALAAKERGERIDGLVLMGIGEPLDNYQNVIRFLHLVNHPDGLGIGYRHISLSTCGLVDRIAALAEEDLPITLSISLHAPTDDIRNRLMPINQKWDLERLLSACRAYFLKTKRRISFEYTLVRDINDKIEHARALASLLRRFMRDENGKILPFHVNLIRMNDVPETGLFGTTAQTASNFESELLRLGINATTRRRLGPDICASCGQLRRAASEVNIS